MKLITSILIATSAVAFAGELPLVEFIDASHPSQDDHNATINLPDGKHVHAHLLTFGSDKVLQAMAFGRTVTDADRYRVLKRKAEELYPGNKFFQNAFIKFAG